MKTFETTFDIVVYRFALMMLVVIGSFVLNVPFLAVLAVPIFLTAMLGIKFEFTRKPAREAKLKNLAANQVAA